MLTNGVDLRSYVVKAGLNALYLTGVHHLMAPYTRGRGAVLMFHRVRPDQSSDFAPNAGLEITPEFLASVVNRVREQGIDIVDLDEARRRLGDPTARRFCAVTFDDGYRDNFQYAYPILKELDCPFTIYVATGLIDRTADLWWVLLEEVIARQTSIAISRDGPTEIFPCRSLSEKNATCETLGDWLFKIDEDRQRAVIRELAWRYGVDRGAIVDAEMMDWDEVKAIAADPLVTIGAHTVDHYMLSKLPLQRARAEMRDGAKVIEAAIGKAPRHFAYPYGSVVAAGEREFELAAELGFSTAVTTRRGVLAASNSERPTAWPRVSINGHYQSLHYLDLFLSGAVFAIYQRLMPEKWEVPRAAAKVAASSLSRHRPAAPR